MRIRLAPITNRLSPAVMPMIIQSLPLPKADRASGLVLLSAVLAWMAAIFSATVASVNQMATTYEFEATAGEVWHAAIEPVPGNSNHTVYISDIALYGENDANAISALAAEIEAFDSCNFTAEAKFALVAKYQAVS